MVDNNTGLREHRQGVNFTNILRAAFSYESFARSFFVLRFKVCTFWRKNIGAKAASNMLVKLTQDRMETFNATTLVERERDGGLLATHLRHGHDFRPGLPRDGYNAR
jgi:hypothetical protein